MTVRRLRRAVAPALLLAGSCGFPSYEFAPCEDGDPACAARDAASVVDAATVDAAFDAALDGGHDPDRDASAPVNLVDEPGCERGIGFWNAFHATVSCDPTHHRTGAASFLIAYDPKAGGTYYSLARAQPLVEAPPMGTTYHMTVWVRSDVAGRNAQLVLRQEGGATPDEERASGNVTTASEWRKLEASITVGAADRTALTGHVAQYGATSGDSFNVDDIELVVVP